MGIIKNLLARFRHTAVLLLVGLLLIIYIAFGFLYLQQGTQQKQFEEQIAKLGLVVARPLPNPEKLQAEYDEVNLALAPIKDSDAIAMLVGIAEKSGIDIDEASGKLRVPTVTVKRVTVGSGTYQVMSFKGIHVQGDDDNIMAFISDLDAGETLKTMVLKRAGTREVTVVVGGKEGARRAEFRKVAAAVKTMMSSNNLAEILHPLNFAGGVATNFMGDNTTTENMAEGFPDITTMPAEKGYTGTDPMRSGYVLYGHHKTNTDNTTQFQVFNYINVLTTEYYYTCELDGTVRQFNGPSIAEAMEYLTSSETKIETEATIDVDIYVKPKG